MTEYTMTDDASIIAKMTDTVKKRLQTIRPQLIMGNTYTTAAGSQVGEQEMKEKTV